MFCQHWCFFAIQHQHVLNPAFLGMLKWKLVDNLNSTFSRAWQMHLACKMMVKSLHLCCDLCCLFLRNNMSCTVRWAPHSSCVKSVLRTTRMWRLNLVGTWCAPPVSQPGRWALASSFSVSSLSLWGQLLGLLQLFSSFTDTLIQNVSCRYSLLRTVRVWREYSRSIVSLCHSIRSCLDAWSLNMK